MATGQLRVLGVVIAATLVWAAQPPMAEAQLGGILIDADGVLRVRTFHDPGGRVLRARIAAAQAAFDQELSRTSPLRKVSINRLEAALANSLANNRQPTEAMRHLAGLTHIQYVFYYPANKDIVLAGPAEGWVHDVSGRTIGMHSGQPILELQDLIVALRAHAPERPDAPVVSVSIDPTQEGLAKMQDFLRSLRGIRPSDAPQIVRGLQTSLGLQDVSIRGVPANTHFAQVLVEADYRMKLIGIGLERPPVKLAIYVDKADPASVSRNALQRWYFVPDYECVRISDDGTAMEMVGEGVKLLGEDEVVSADGTRRASGRVDRASSMFTRSFTRMYPQLAAASPIWAQLRNMIDISVAAAFIRSQGIYDQSGWDLGVFRDEEAYPVQIHTTPVRVESAVNSIWKRNTLMTPIGGGVRIEATRALAEDNLLADEKGAVKAARAKIDPGTIDHDRWWWD